jgi:tetratricopeptide (TPR) repeat protein
MQAPGIDPAAQLAGLVAHYRETGNLSALLSSLDELALGAEPEALMSAVEPYRDMVEVAGPLYERIVEQRPEDARALIILANCYWLSGRGPDVVSALATRAIAADPTARGAWHLWALAEADLRTRVGRWEQVVARFPDDDLARVNLADNAASLASTDHDDRALRMAIDSYRVLRERATQADQREALDRAIGVLEEWRL